MFKLSPLTLLISAAFASPAVVMANTGASIAPAQVDEYITVTATRTERYFMESPAAIASISAEDIRRSSADSIADALRDIPGILVSDAATPGMKRITLRGESSLRVAILIDGQEVTDHSTHGAPLLLDTTMVERVEVIRGTSSVLYGGKALGGVINIITKKGGVEPIQASISAGFNSATSGQQVAGAVYGHVAGIDYRIAASSSDHNDRVTPVGKIASTSFANDSQMIYLAKELDDHHVGLNYEKFNLNSEIATGIPGFSLDMPQRDRQKLAAFYTYESAHDVLNKFHVDAYKQRIDRNFVQHMEMSIPMRPPASMDMIIDTNIMEKLDTLGANGQLDFSINEQHSAIVGVQLTQDDLNKATNNSNTSTMHMPNLPAIPNTKHSQSIEDATLKTKAIYVQDEWRVSDKLIITAGARQYWVNANLNQSSNRSLGLTQNRDTKLIGSLAANYGVDQHNNMRIVLSQGYHYPTLLQIATGATAAGNYINPNSALQPETSDNIELGYRLFTDQWLVDTTIFYTDAANYIAMATCKGSKYSCVNPARDKVFVNADTAKTTGLELSVNYNATKQLAPYANITLLSRQESYANFTTKDTGTPALYGKIGVKYHDESASLGAFYLDAYLRAASSADEASADGSTEVFDSWNTVNIAFGTTFGAQQQYMVNAQISNLLDRQYTSATQTIMAPGRAMMLKLSTSF